MIKRNYLLKEWCCAAGSYINQPKKKKAPFTARVTLLTAARAHITAASVLFSAMERTQHQLHHLQQNWCHLQGHLYQE
jgi:hypothetical protein